MNFREQVLDIINEKEKVAKRDTIDKIKKEIESLTCAHFSNLLLKLKDTNARKISIPHFFDQYDIHIFTIAANELGFTYSPFYSSGLFIPSCRDENQNTFAQISFNKFNKKLDTLRRAHKNIIIGRCDSIKEKILHGEFTYESSHNGIFFVTVRTEVKIPTDFEINIVADYFSKLGITFLEQFDNVWKFKI